jgi:hypothetical protein
MDCPKCGERWRVLNTASKDDDSRQHLRCIGTELLSWYSEEFVVRHRRCLKCYNQAITIEVDVSDLISIAKICASEGMPSEFIEASQLTSVKITKKSS